MLKVGVGVGVGGAGVDARGGTEVEERLENLKFCRNWNPKFCHVTKIPWVIRKNLQRQWS